MRFRAILWTQWLWTRTILGVTTVLAFLFPVFAWRVGSSREFDPREAQALVGAFESLGSIAAAVAILTAFLIAVQAWTVDAQSHHVYPLSLPVRWRDYILQRFGAGALSLLLPTLGLYAGCLATLSLVTLPPTLRAYPGALAARFYLMALFVYALAFAFQQLAGRRAVYAALWVLLAIFIPLAVLDILGFSGALEAIAKALFDWPGPFAVLTAPWRLIDA